MDEQKIFYSGSPVYISRAESNDKGFWVHNLTDDTQAFVNVNPEPLPKIEVDKAETTTKPRVATDKTTIKKLLQEEFKERSDRMISLLEEANISNVLNDEIYLVK